MKISRRLTTYLTVTTILLVFAAASFTVPLAYASHVSDTKDVKVTKDNNNKDGGTPNPGFDAKNRQSNEPSVAISPANSNIVAIGANDYRMVPVFGDAWAGLYVSLDGGATWHNTFIPGFPSDTSPAGLSSPLLGLDGAGDPTVRFDLQGNLYYTGIAFNRDFDQADKNLDTVIFAAKYQFTPGTAAGTSTPNSAGNPPGFTYQFTTLVSTGAVGFAVPEQPFGFAGDFDDKSWLAVDTNPSSPCFGNVYVSFTRFTGLAGAFPIVFSRSTNGGQTFSEPLVVSTGGQDGTTATQGSNIGVAPDGTVYVSYRTFATSSDPNFEIQVVRSSDCGAHFTQPVVAATFIPMPRQVAGLSFRTPTESWIAADDTDSNVVYVAFMALAGSPANADVFVARSVDGGSTWGAKVRVNDDTTNKHQFWPAIDVEAGVLHVIWYDFRDSRNPSSPSLTNDLLKVFYACSNCAGNTYPSFSHNVEITDVGHQPNCRMFGGGTVGFHGDYIELAAGSTGSTHVVHVAWTDNRDVPTRQCDLDPAAGPASNNIGNRNQNIYTDTLTVQV